MSYRVLHQSSTCKDLNSFTRSCISLFPLKLLCFFFPCNCLHCIFCLFPVSGFISVFWVMSYPSSVASLILLNLCSPVDFRTWFSGFNSKSFLLSGSGFSSSSHEEDTLVIPTALCVISQIVLLRKYF